VESKIEKSTLAKELVETEENKQLDEISLYSYARMILIYREKK